MYILAKFFEKRAYQEDFMNGNLYLSSLSTFKKTYPEKELEEAILRGDKRAEGLLKLQHNNSQRDVFEGTVATLPPNSIPELPEDFRLNLCRDIMIQSLGYDYCNLMCFCKIEYCRKIINGKLVYKYQEPKMKDFGDYVVIIKKPKVFLQRVEKAISEKGYDYICGSVNYHPITFNGGLAEHKNSMIISTHNSFDISDLMQRDQSKRIDYDAFDKCNAYKSQNEWRLVVDNHVANDQPLRINVGDLSDVVIRTRRDNLAEKLQRHLGKYEISPIQDGYFGNISRASMREQFYQMGENKGYLTATIG